MISLDTKLGELGCIPELGEIAKYILYCDHDFLKDYGITEMKIADVGLIGWNPESMRDGINFLIEQNMKGNVQNHYVYPIEEVTDPQQMNVSLIHIKPDEVDLNKPYIVLVSGGAYANVGHGAEAFPTAIHMVKQGYQVFVFTYRVGENKAVTRAMEDMAMAMKYIKKNAEKMNVVFENYCMAGYSAGGSVITSWGTKNVGYAVYDLPKPKALFPIYALVDLKRLKEKQDSESLKAVMKDGWDGLTVMLGKNYTFDELEKYNVIQQIDEEYPPCYIVCGEDDVLIDPYNSIELEKTLKSIGVKAVLEMGKKAPHGFGDGRDTDVEGWPERALEFIENL